MTTCNICFDEFIMETDEETAGLDLDISIALRCETPNCKAIVCNGCEVKLQNELKRNPIGIIKCPLCRQQYFKNHLMWTVLEEELKNKIKQKKRSLKSRIKYLQKELDESIEILKTYE